MTQKFRVKKVVNITDKDGLNAVFYEIFEIVVADGEERLHRKVDLAFRNEEEARKWVSEHNAKD